MFKSIVSVQNENVLPTEQEEYMMLIEGSEAVEGDLIGYIPGLRLGVKGNTKEELISSAKELIRVMKEEGSTFYKDAEFINLIV